MVHQSYRSSRWAMSRSGNAKGGIDLWQGKSIGKVRDSIERFSLTPPTSHNKQLNPSREEVSLEQRKILGRGHRCHEFNTA
jgi:hypothetical protein